ncbi:endospore germination permease [Aneurinibacillus sp. BA2021]|nr:endospore germination permease [Aneurinibacillus sp. BA2021]
MRRTGQKHPVVWVRQRFGKPIAWLVAGLAILHLLLTGSITLRDTVTWAHTSFLEATPIWAILLLISFICFLGSCTGIRTLVVTNGILLPFVIFLGFFVATGNIPRKNYEYVLPVFEHGYQPVLLGMLYVASGFAEGTLLLFFQHHLKAKVTYTTFIILTVIFTGLTLGPTMGALAEFGNHGAVAMRYPAYEEWRLLSFGKYFERVDFFSIYQWLVGAFIRISLSLYLVVEILEVQSGKKRVYFLAVLTVLFMAATLFPISDMIFLELLYKWLLPISLGLLLVLSFLLGILSLTKKKEKVREA